MSRDHPDDMPQDPLLERYREANALDAARPGPALRENVLAHARAAAASRADTAQPDTRPAANDSAWTWRALGSLAVVGLVGLLVLQFDRSRPEEKEAAFGTAAQRPAPTASAPAAPEAPAVTPPVVPAPARSAAKPAAVDSTRSASKMAPAQEPEVALVPPAPPAPPAPAAPVVPPAPMAAAKPAPMPKATQAPEAMAPASPAPATALAPPPAAALAEGSGAGAVARSPAPGLARERRENSAADAVAAPPAYPLHAAVTAGDAAAVRQWLARGANPNQRDAKDHTPLMLAADRGDGAIVRLLVDAGADRSLRDPQGLTAADHAERAGHRELLPLLR
ncbi:ankyrin repeat domain-containing protein [Hydrogenophaga sp. MI9]|uniref:ankyrin repeat domain-containing protein n=1 Tax=Hydrogenophaga sp. MI9 TaxID=3453719 RepID=UPI003EF0016E